MSFTNPPPAPSFTAWWPCRDADAQALALFARHYTYRRSRDRRRRTKFVGPGEYSALITADGLALFVWRLFIDKCPLAGGINCAVFRNEGPLLSSDLIREADALAWRKWPDHRRHYTYVNSRKVQSENPGYCFIKAGWRRCGITAGGLVVLEIVSP